MDEKPLLDKLYNQNLMLGIKINTLNDQNNFYKIQINNFNKLTNSINKDLYKLGINFQNRQVVDDSAKVGPLFIISNKIKLKNLQLKIGNSIRQTEKFKKNLEGSLPHICKQVQNLQQEISIILAKYLQMSQQNQLLRDIMYGDQIQTAFKQFKQSQKQSKHKPDEINIDQLEIKKKQATKKLQFAKKQQKQKNRTLSQLINTNHILSQQIKKLKSLYPEDIYLNQLHAEQAKQLQKLQINQKKLINQISIKSKQLQELYIVNKECKQRINDKKYQQNKQIRVLQQQVAKCKEQVREFKQKYRKIRFSIGKQKQRQKQKQKNKDKEKDKDKIKDKQNISQNKLLS